MATCVNEECRRTIPDPWAFCTYCGVDNRPPERQRQTEVICNRHAYPNIDCFCIYCGEPGDEPYGVKRSVRYRVGFTFVVVGLFLLIATFAIVVAHYKGGFLEGWVASWWSRPVNHVGGSRGSRYVYQSELGDDVTFWGFGSAATALFIGFGLLMKFDFDRIASKRRDRFW